MSLLGLGFDVGSDLAFDEPLAGDTAWEGTQNLNKIKTIEHLRLCLQAAIEVEHMTIPPYLTAMYTIKPGTNREAYNVIRSVVMEEMLHMTLAANILTAVGGTPRTTYPDFVKYPACVPCRRPPLWTPLRPFSKEAIELFLTIESPKGHEYYVRCTESEEMKKIAPTKNWGTIGEFYGIIRELLQKLVKNDGEGKVFTGRPERQVGPEDFYNSGGEVIKVHDLETAMLAMKIIVDEGEGLHHGIFTSDDRLFHEERQVAHYFRFNEIMQQRRYSPYDTPKSGPTGEPLEVDWTAVYPIKVPANPDEVVKPCREGSEVRKHVDRFNIEYAKLLVLLEQSFNGYPRVIAEAIPIMWDLKYRAEGILRNPHTEPEYKGCNANPTFEIAFGETS